MFKYTSVQFECKSKSDIYIYICYDDYDDDIKFISTKIGYVDPFLVRVENNNKIIVIR